ncbi:hypothetical protein, partial [Bacteroides pyogenes]|uniref:hypothetical protein n=1 Tax=Bacteroides pyogenes TaxID=310300 RepID=UPI001BA97772
MVGNGNCWKSFYEKFLNRFAYKKGYSISVLQPECVFSVFHIKGYGGLCHALSFRVVESDIIYFSCFYKKNRKKFRIIKVNVYLCRIEMDSVTYQVTAAFNRFFQNIRFFLIRFRL